jgi:hypothetical protein
LAVTVGTPMRSDASGGTEDTSGGAGTPGAGVTIAIAPGSNVILADVPRGTFDLNNDIATVFKGCDDDEVVFSVMRSTQAQGFGQVINRATS